MKLFKKGISIVGLTSLLVLASCGGGGSSGGGGVYVSDAYFGWYDEYGYECGSLGPGCNYYSDGFQIVDVEDPYWDSPGLWDDYYSYYYGEYVYESPSGIIYDDWGNALNKGKEIGNGRDVITNVAEAEKKGLENTAKYYANKFGITQSQGLKLARTLNDFATLQSRTEQDIADFTKRLYGVNFSNIKNAVEKASEGDQTALQGVISEAASNFNITPESMKTMVKSLHSNLLKNAGIELK